MSLVALFLTFAHAADIGVGSYHSFPGAKSLAGVQATLGQEVGPLRLALQGTFDLTSPNQAFQRALYDRLQTASLSPLGTTTHDVGSVALLAELPFVQKHTDVWWVSPSLIGGIEARTWRNVTFDTRQAELLEGARFSAGPVGGVAATIHHQDTTLQMAMTDRTLWTRRPTSFESPTPQPRLLHTPTVTFTLSQRIGARS